VEAVRRFNSRRRSPSIRALRDAGPPIRWLIAAGIGSLLLVIVLFVVGVRDDRVLVALPFFVFVGVCAADRRGWRIRMATAEVAARQRERWQWGALPIDPLAADAWMAAHADAPPEERATVLATAGRLDEARAVLERATPVTALDGVRLERLRILFSADEAEDHSIDNALARLEQVPALTDVPPDEQRYQRLSLAWSISWLRIRAGEPWRDDFAEAVRPYAPFRVAPRYLLVHVIQQFALPIAYAGALLIVWGFGLLDVFLQS
jgi:hypothetical protein